jgi:molybdopterin-guanine dinucleotide biosynthesis protein B
MHELHGAPELHLFELLPKLAPVDLVVVEGFKREPLPKIEVHRAGNGKPFLFPDDNNIVGIVADISVETRLPSAHVDDISAIATLVQRAAMPVEEIDSVRAARG